MMRPRHRPPTRSMVWVGGVLAVVAAIVAALTRPFTPPQRPRATHRSRSVYEPGAAGTPAISPFHLDIQPMRALALFNFERDPDVIYQGLEPQVFDDDVHGRGLAVIGWRVDGRVDVFHDPALRLDPATYGIAGGGLHRIQACDLGAGRVELGPAGASIDLAFTDLEGRPIRLVVHETDTRPRRPFALLAPMGTAATDPTALPLVFVKDFYFVRRAGSEVRIEIGGRAHRSDTLPLVLDGTWMRFVRYAATPFVVWWNRADHDTAHVVSSPTDTSSTDTIGSGATRFEVHANGPFTEIHRMTRAVGAQQVTVEFTPAFPHLLALRDGAESDGAFQVSTEPPAGVVSGTWQVTRRGRCIEIDLDPSGGWTPGDVPPMARVLFRVIGMFRSWPMTYRWRATIDLPGPDEDVGDGPALRSRWVRDRRRREIRR